MLSGNTFHLITLGGVALIGSDGEEDESLRKRRRKLALLVVLVLAGRPIPRDALIDMFWGDQNETRARHSLSDALSSLRRVLGRSAIAGRHCDVTLAPALALRVDVADFTAAMAASDAAHAVSLYTGPFLNGVYVDRSATFEQWVTCERDRLERLFLRACEVRCLALARARQWDECAALARRWLDTAPLSVDAALYLLNALKAPGTRDAEARALAEYQRMATALRSEHALAPDPSITRLAHDLAQRFYEPEPAPSPLSADPSFSITTAVPLPALPTTDSNNPSPEPESSLPAAVVQPVSSTRRTR